MGWTSSVEMDAVFFWLHFKCSTQNANDASDWLLRSVYFPTVWVRYRHEWKPVKRELILKHTFFWYPLKLVATSNTGWQPKYYFFLLLFPGKRTQTLATTYEEEKHYEMTNSAIEGGGWYQWGEIDEIQNSRREFVQAEEGTLKCVLQRGQRAKTTLEVKGTSGGDCYHLWVRVDVGLGKQGGHTHCSSTSLLWHRDEMLHHTSRLHVALTHAQTRGDSYAH